VIIIDISKCSICGKEKKSNVLPYINRTVYVECECEKQLRLKKEEEKRQKAREICYKRRMNASGILKREETAFFENLIEDEHNQKAIVGAKYITALMLKCDQCKEKNGLILSGNRGSGKTFIAAAVINEYNKNEPVSDNIINAINKARENGYIDDLGFKIDSNCRFIKEKDVIQLYDRYKEKTPPIDEFKKAKILVVDDVGSSYGDSKKIISHFFDLFDYRYSQELTTIITTNLSKEELKIYLGEATFDRLKNCCHYIKLTSPESRRS